MIFDTRNSIFAKFERNKFNLSNWLEEWYPQICSYLDIDSRMDFIALETVLNEYSSTYSKDELNSKLYDQDVYILAPGIKMEEDFNKYLLQEKSNQGILVTIDGATTYAISKKIIPDIIVTDFDGRIEDQILASRKGSIVLVHCHGDNLNKLQRYLPKIISGRFIITTQIRPLPGSSNFCGFTDGDRAVCLATKMGAKRVFLLGFDLETSIGSYSKPFKLDSNQKKRKLRKFDIAKSVVNWCAFNGQEIYSYGEWDISQ